MNSNRPLREIHGLKARFALMGLCLFLSTFALPLRARAEAVFVLVVHPDNPIDEINRRYLSDLFLKKVKSFPDGEKAAPVEVDTKNPIYLAFAADVHRKILPKLRSYWGKMMFQSGIIPPRQYSSSEKVLGYVKRNPGAIGYVDSSLDLSGVKTLSIDFSE